MSFQGEVIGWVPPAATTRSPTGLVTRIRLTGMASARGQLRGLAHARIGWLLRDDRAPPARYAPDLLADPAMRAASAAFRALCAVSLGVPIAPGCLIGGTWQAALAALLWAGLARVAAAARHLAGQLAVSPHRHPSLRHPPF